MNVEKEEGPQARRREADAADHRLQEGEAFDGFFDRHGGGACSLAYRMSAGGRPPRTRPGGLPVDLAQRHRPLTEARGSLRSWVLTVVHNRAIDPFRRQARDKRRR